MIERWRAALFGCCGVLLSGCDAGSGDRALAEATSEEPEEVALASDRAVVDGAFEHAAERGARAAPTPGPAKSPTSDGIAELRAKLRLPLRERAQLSELGEKSEHWDHAVNLSLAVRARIEVLRAGELDQTEAGQVYARVSETADLVLDYEAEGPRGAPFLPESLRGARGWGTSKGIRIGKVSESATVDAYSTGTVLVGLAELARYAMDHGKKEDAQRLLAALEPITEHWIDQRRFEFSEGFHTWDKLVTESSDVRRFAVFNTDALLARAILVQGLLVEQLGDQARAQRYRDIARDTARSLRRLVTDVTVDEAGNLHPERWSYGLERVSGQSVRPQRQEDSNHAAFVLDFIALASERGLSDADGKPLFSPTLLGRMCRLLSEQAFVKTPGGAIAYEVYVDEEEALAVGRGKKKIAAFSFRPEGARQTPIASWWKELAGSSRTLDMGLSIRTSWGWAQCARSDRALLAHLGEYLRAATTPSKTLAANLFLSHAVWYRMSR